MVCREEVRGEPFRFGPGQAQQPRRGRSRESRRGRYHSGTQDVTVRHVVAGRLARLVRSARARHGGRARLASLIAPVSRCTQQFDVDGIHPNARRSGRTVLPERSVGNGGQQYL